MILESGGKQGVNLLYPWLLGPIQGVVVVVPLEEYQEWLPKFFAGDLVTFILTGFALSTGSVAAGIVAALWQIAFTVLRFRAQRAIKIHISSVSATVPSPAKFYFEHACHLLGIGLVVLAGLSDWSATGPLARTFGILLIVLSLVIGLAPAAYALRWRGKQA